MASWTPGTNNGNSWLTCDVSETLLECYVITHSVYTVLLRVAFVVQLLRACNFQAKLTNTLKYPNPNAAIQSSYMWKGFECK